jgi:hypothetical protein
MYKIHNYISILFLLMLSIILPFSMSKAEDNIQILKDFLHGTKEYKFVVLPEDTPLIPSFPIETLKSDPEIKSIETIDRALDYYRVTIDAGDQTDSKVNVEYYIHSSIENARIEMMEYMSLDFTSIPSYSSLDYKTDHKIGDNCWYDAMRDSVIYDSGINIIRFLRNNVRVIISNTTSSDNPYAVIAVAEKVDKALINCEKVATSDLMKAPVINSYEIVSGSLVAGTSESIKTEINATDPMGEKLMFRRYSLGRISSENITSWGTPFAAGTTYKYIVWVMNESHLTSMAVKEITF